MDIISKSDARYLGLKTYFTGRPCTRGHYAARYVNGSACVECSRIYGLKRRARELGVDEDDFVRNNTGKVDKYDASTNTATNRSLLNTVFK